MKHLVAFILGLSLAACGTAPPIREIPKPHTSIPYGYLALEVNIGNLKDARLVVSRAISIPRNTLIPNDGILVLKLPAGLWEVHVKGRPFKDQVVRFNKDVKASPKKERTLLMKQWPKKSLEVKVVKNRLTWVGRLCAHPGCEGHWSAFEHSALRAWEDQDRLLIYQPPEEKAPVKKKADTP